MYYKFVSPPTRTSVQTILREKSKGPSRMHIGTVVKTMPDGFPRQSHMIFPQSGIYSQVVYSKPKTWIDYWVEYVAQYVIIPVINFFYHKIWLGN